MEALQPEINTEAVTGSFLAFYHEAKDLLNITDEKSHERALSFVEELLEDVEDNDDVTHELIDLVADAIEKYEDSAEDYTDFNVRVDAIDPANAMLRIIMDQHGLGMGDFKNEIGGKSNVSMILSDDNDRSLTREHIEALSKRFGLPIVMFFP